jgi:IS5 family transposase
MGRQPGFFDVDDRLKRLSDLGDQLEAFRAIVNFEIFRPQLNAALVYSDGAQGGRPPFDPVMMFKILVIQTTNNLSDERTEFLINDRLSFMRLSGAWIVELRARRPHDLVVPGETHKGRRHRTIV